MIFNQSSDVPLCEVASSKTVLKPGPDGPGEDPREAAELFDIPESLKVGSIDELPDIFGEGNEAIDGVMDFSSAGDIFFFVVTELIHVI